MSGVHFLEIDGSRFAAPGQSSILAASPYTPTTAETTAYGGAKLIEAPFDRYRCSVEPAWIDYNGHMNVAYYLLAFDRATDLFLDFVGLDQAQRKASNGTTFAAETHLCYHRELMVAAPLKVATQLLSYDSKRLRYLHRMYHEEEGYLAATAEVLSLYIELETRRVGQLPGPVAARLAAIHGAHKSLGIPKEAGKAIQLPVIAAS